MQVKEKEKCGQKARSIQCTQRIMIGSDKLQKQLMPEVVKIIRTGTTDIA